MPFIRPGCSFFLEVVQVISVIGLAESYEWMNQDAEIRL
jgi:hypothetical protein